MTYKTQCQQLKKKSNIIIFIDALLFYFLLKLSKKKAAIIPISIYSFLKTCFVVCSIFVAWFPFSYITFSFFSDP